MNVATASGASVASPTGAIFAYAGATAPGGWLVCDGSAVSRTTYSLLFAVTGTHYGAGDGSTTFNLPDLRGRAAVGYVSTGGNADVSTLGNNEGIGLANRRPKHRHTVNDPGHYHQVGANSSSNFNTDPGSVLHRSTINTSNGGSGGQTTGITIGASTNDALDAPAYLVLNHIIKT